MITVIQYTITVESFEDRVAFLLVGLSIIDIICQQVHFAQP